jgi:hypothetical protein
MKRVLPGKRAVDAITQTAKSILINRLLETDIAQSGTANRTVSTVDAPATWICSDIYSVKGFH